MGGSIRHTEEGKYGEYLTVAFRNVIADALDEIDRHVTNNYRRLERGDDWFWVGLAGVIGLQVILCVLAIVECCLKIEVLWVIAQICWQKRARSKARVKEEVSGGTQGTSRV